MHGCNASLLCSSSYFWDPTDSPFSTYSHLPPYMTLWAILSFQLPKGCYVLLTALSKYCPAEHSGACHSFCSVIPCGWNCTCSISVSEMLLNLYVAFISWEKSGTSGEKPRPRLCFHDKKDLAAVAVQEIPAFSCLLPFSGWKTEGYF